MPPYLLQKRDILLLLPRYPRLPDLATLTVDQILELRPLIAIPRLLARSSPLLTVLPLSHENDAPNHYDKCVEEVSRTVFGCEGEGVVVGRSQHAHQGWEDQPALEEGHEVEVGLGVGSQIFFHIAQNDASVFRILVDRDQLFEPRMPHDIGQGVYLRIDVVGGSLLLDGVGEEIVVLGPEVLVRRKQRQVGLIIAVLVGQVLVNFALVEDGVLLLRVDFAVLPGEARANPLEVVAEGGLLGLLG